MVNSLVALTMMGVAAWIDLKAKVVPDWLSLGGMAIGILLSCLCPSVHNAGTWWTGGMWAIASCVIVVFVMCWYTNITEHFLRCDTLGGGDIKIMGALATMLNWKVMLAVFLTAPVFGLVHFAWKRLHFEVYSIPYCPSLLAALTFSIVFCKPMWGLIF